MTMHDIDRDFEDLEEELEFQRDPVSGKTSKKPTIAILNKRKVSQWEMDELFCEEEA